MSVKSKSPARPSANYVVPSAQTSSWLKRMVFLGTGTSGQVPAIHCLTGPDSENVKCDACRDSLNPGSLNRRGCTSVALLGGGEKSAEESLILIDVGPSFYSSALANFRSQKFREITAVLLTHAHSDAILGLDNLRAWTLGNVIQSRVKVYLTKECSETVSSMFPYLFDSSKATGGGGVGAIEWIIIDDDKPFEIPIKPYHDQNGIRRDALSVTPLPTWHGFSNGNPFQCLGYRIDDLSYVSDCHEIPTLTTDLMKGSQCVVIDALRYDRHPSHFSVPQAISLGLSLSYPSPPLLLLTDLTHRLEHNSLECQLQTFVKGMRTFVSNREAVREDIQKFKESSTSSVTKARMTTRSKVGEGNGFRWWNSIWSEHDSERNQNLNLKKEADDHGYQDKNQLGKELVPEFHVAFDGMSIDFDKHSTG